MKRRCDGSTSRSDPKYSTDGHILSQTEKKKSNNIKCENENTNLRKGLIGQKIEHTTNNESHSTKFLPKIFSWNLQSTFDEALEILPCTETPEDIDKILDYKAEKTNLSVTNVKNILKNVIMNENFIRMFHSSLQGNQTEIPFEPKITRFKVRELRKKNQPLSSVCTFPLTDITPQPIDSECKVLIDEELSDDTSDEEYMPSDEAQSDDEESMLSNASFLSAAPSTSKKEKNESFKKHKDNLKNTIEESDKKPIISNGCSNSINLNSTGLNQSYNDNNTFSNACEETKETIGYRTRSKFSLSETPLETIEQQFIPPDVTCDMYEWNYDNEDWKEFLKEFTQPLEALPSLNETNDDVEADPEYNVLADEDAAVEDTEELRMDRGVKISKKELNDLMTELCEYGEMWTNLEEERKNQEKAKKKLKKHDKLKFKELSTNQSNDSSSTHSNLRMNLNQKFLFEQQLRQHIQLTTQHYLQTYRHPVLHYLSPPLKNHLDDFKKLVLDNTSSPFSISNLTDAITVVEKWECILGDDKYQHIIKFMEKEIEISDKCLESQVLRVCEFPKELMHLMRDSTAFPYPLLLPPLPFYSYNLPEEFLPSEDQLLILGYDSLLPFIKENKKRFKIAWSMNYAASLISKNLMPVHSSSKIFKHTKNQRKRKKMNPIKEYFSKNRVRSIIHYVVPIINNTTLKNHPEELLPHVWSDFLKECVTNAISNT